MMELLSVVTCLGSGGSSGSGRNCQLPATALQLIMSLVRVSDRHGCSRSLALVCKSWAAAVAAASMEVEDIVLHRCADYDSFQRWLNKYGRRLQKLRANLRPIACLAGGAVSRSQLPCPPVCLLSELQQPHLQHAELQLTGPNSICSALAAATKLSSLRLENCAITLFQTGPADTAAVAPADAAAVATDVTTAGAALLAAIVQVPTLQDLSLSDLRVDWVLAPTLGERVIFSQHTAELPTAAIHALQGLTQLQLQGVRFEDSVAALQHIGSMTSLQHLQLGGWPNPFERERSLAWPAFADPYRVGPMHVEVSGLTGLTQLSHFGLRYARLCNVGGGAQYMDAWLANVLTLLRWLPELPYLSSLQLQGVQGLAQTRGMPLVTPSSFRRLTSGSALQHIDLRETDISEECWKQAFPAVAQLPSITSLMFGDSSTPKVEVAAAVAMRSCPKVRSLVITSKSRCMYSALEASASFWSPESYDSFRHDGALKELLREATSLTALSLSLKNCYKLSILSTLATLPQLKHLHLADCTVGLDVSARPWPAAARRASPLHFDQHLSVLMRATQLTFLGISGPDWPETEEQCRASHNRVAAAYDDEPSAVQLALEDKVWRLAFVSQAAPSRPPDVCQQLQHRLRKYVVVFYAARCHKRVVYYLAARICRVVCGWGICFLLVLVVFFVLSVLRYHNILG